MVTTIDDEVLQKHSNHKQNKIHRLFVCGSAQNNRKTKTSSKSVKKRLQLFWKKKINSSNDEEMKWLLKGSTSSHIYTDNKESKNEEIIETKKRVKVKEVEEKEKKKKGLLKKVRKMALQTCRYISLGSAPGFTFNPSPYPYNYETHSYDYYNPTSYGFNYPDSQSYSPSLFF